MKIIILAVGSINKSFIKDGINFFVSKIKKYSKIEIIETKEFNNKSKMQNIKSETIFINNKLKSYNDFYKIILDINGNQINSIFFSDIMSECKNFKNGKILFIIGGSNGIDYDFLDKTDKKITFGKITFPHQLFRLILVEQIYRRFKIINNEKYHK